MDEEWIVIDGDEEIDHESLNYVNRTKFLSAVFLTFCCIIGVYGNIMSIVIFSHSSMRSSVNFLLASLSLTDTFLLISIFFVLVLPNLNLTYPTYAVTQIYPYIILILYPVSTMTQTCSVWTHCIISIERYIAIVFPLKKHKLMTITEAKLVQAAVFVCAILYNVVRFWEYELIPVELENRTDDSSSTNNESEYFRLSANLRADPNYFLFYTTTLHVCTHFIFPFSIIFMAHLSVFRSLRRARKRIRGARRSGGGHRGTTFMIMTLTLSFVSFNVLPLAANFWEWIDPRLYDAESEWMRSALVVSELANCLSVLNSSCTFVVYLVYCKKFRRLFLRYSKCATKQELTSVSHNESVSAAYV